MALECWREMQNVGRGRPSAASARTLTRAAGPVILAALCLAGCAAGSSGSSGATGATTTIPSTSVAPTTSTTTTSTTVVTTTTVPVRAQHMVEPPGPLSSGSRGKRTLAIQLALKAQHYDPGAADAKFGLKTAQAVWAWQALHGLPRDGVITPVTEALILARPVQAMMRPELGPTHAEVDITRQVLIVWTNGQPSIITHVSSGTDVPYCEHTKEGLNCGDAITPLGLYTFQREYQGVKVAPLGTLFNPVYFYSGYAVHGEGYVPNHPASHGCVRIPMHISDYFQSLVSLGEKIEVFRS